MQIIAHVSQRELVDLEPGDKATITTDRLPRQFLQGTVAEVRSTRSAGAYDVVFDVDNAQLLLKPGMAVTAKVTTARRDEALRAPDQAFDFSPAHAPSPPEGFSWLWLLRNGKAEAVPVKLGLDDGSFTEILGGEIKPGDRVIIGRTR